MNTAPVPVLKSRKIFSIHAGILYCHRCDTREALANPSEWLRHAEIHHKMFHTPKSLSAMHTVLAPDKHVCGSHCYRHFYEGDI
jgi:hypothetical protein